MIKRTVVSLILLLLSIGACASDDEQFQACLALDQDLGWTEHRALMAEYGITCATLYYNLLSNGNLRNPYGWVKREYLDRGYDVILTLIITTSRYNEDETRNLARRIAEGEFDRELSDFIEAVKQAGNQVVIRPMHEINGDWRPWQMKREDNTTEESLAAFVHIANLFREANAPVTIEVNFNRRDGRPYRVLDEAELYMPVLDEVVDAYSISTYNRCGLNDNYPVERSFAADFRPAYERIRAFTDKPINVAETSTSGLCGLRIPWFAQMIRDIENQFTQIEQLTFFFGKLKPGQSGSEVNVNWGLPSSAERRRFSELLPANTAPVKVENHSSNSVFSTPWSVYARSDELFGETFNPALNPVTGEAFGEDERVFRVTFTQRFLFDIGNRFEIGPALWLGAVQSTNDNMWWNNQYSGGVSLGLMRDFDRDGAIKWGSWSADLFAERRQYTVDVPDRFENDGENRYGFRLTFNFGGDWTQ